MPRVTLKWHGVVHQLLKEAADDLVSLVVRSNKYKAKDPALAIFSDAEIVTLQSAIAALDDAEEEVTTR